MTILSDCKPAVQIFNKLPTTTPARILRFVLRVQDINYVIKHIDGKENPSDWLSRITHFHQDDLKYHTQSAELETAIVKSIQIQHNHLTLDQIKNETHGNNEPQAAPQVERQGRNQRRVGFNPTVQVRNYREESVPDRRLRSSGPAIEFPNVAPAALEFNYSNSRNYRRTANENIRQFDEQQAQAQQPMPQNPEAPDESQ